MEIFIQYGLLPYIILNFSLTFVWPSYRVWRKTGVVPITFAKTDSAHDYIGKVFKRLLGGILITGIIYTFYTEGVKYLMPIQYLENVTLQVLGLIILLLAFIWIVLAQYQMALSWRIGIDTEHSTHLITEGVFRISRNPIFLGMMSTLLGLFLIIPNMVTLLILFNSYILIQIQIRLEEDFLLKTHQQHYLKYCQSTPRWL